MGRKHERARYKTSVTRHRGTPGAQYTLWGVKAVADLLLLFVIGAPSAGSVTRYAVARAHMEGMACHAATGGGPVAAAKTRGVSS